MQLDPAHLATLAAILRTGSLETAAAQLAVTPSAVSQRLRALEDRVGAVLVQRGQPCTATALGERLAQHAQAIALLESDLAAEIGQSVDSGVVRIAVNADSLATWVPAAFAALRQDLPGIQLDLVIDDQDHSADWLRRGAVAAAVTGRAQPVQGCDALPLGSLTYTATASPAFVQQWFSEGVSADTLARAPVLTFNPKDKLQSDWIALRAGRPLTPPRHLIPSSEAFVAATEAGLGWGLNPDPLIRGALSGGRLVAIAPEHPHGTALHWQISRHLSQPLRALTRAVRRAARQELAPFP